MKRKKNNAKEERCNKKSKKNSFILDYFIMKIESIQNLKLTIDNKFVLTDKYEKLCSFIECLFKNDKNYKLLYQPKLQICFALKKTQ